METSEDCVDASNINQSVEIQKYGDVGEPNPHLLRRKQRYSSLRLEPLAGIRISACKKPPALVRALRCRFHSNFKDPLPLGINYLPKRNTFSIEG